MLETQKSYCPYCGELIEVVIDMSVEQQDYIEDCSVCCRPITVNVSIDPIAQDIALFLSAEDD